MTTEPCVKGTIAFIEKYVLVEEYVMAVFKSYA